MYIIMVPFLISPLIFLSLLICFISEDYFGAHCYHLIINFIFLAIRLFNLSKIHFLTVIK
jgi:hypothetical protein